MISAGFWVSKSDPGKTRTYNLLIRSQMLYPLSYGAFLKAMQI